jgi:hypothetical protein
MPNRVVNLNNCRDLLGKWSILRERIVRGEVSGIAVCIKGRDGEETVVLCGDYDANPSAALKAAMKMSWALTQKADLHTL